MNIDLCPRLHIWQHPSLVRTRTQKKRKCLHQEGTNKTRNLSINFKTNQLQFHTISTRNNRRTPHIRRQTDGPYYSTMQFTQRRPTFYTGWFGTIGVTEIKLDVVIYVLLWEHYCKFIVKTQWGVFFLCVRVLLLWGMMICFIVSPQYVTWQLLIVYLICVVITWRLRTGRR